MVIAVYCIFLAACAGVDGTDWQSKVGHYSLDDARRELGNPESCVGLDNGGTACSWTKSRTKESIDKIVLTFAPNGQLTTVNKVHF